MDSSASVLSLQRLLKKRAERRAPSSVAPPLAPESDAISTEKGIFVPIEKLLEDEQIVTGIVLRPNTTDAQGDIYDAEVVRRAAHSFLSKYNSATKLGHQHNDFKDWKSRFALVESFIAPIDFVLGTKTVNAGSWVMSVKVLDSKLWKMVKAGELTGFSVGGRAKVKPIQQQ